MTPSNSSTRDHAFKAVHGMNIYSFKMCHITDKTSVKISESIQICKYDPDLDNKFFSIKLNILT